MCDPATVPSRFQDVLDWFTSQGLRVVGLACKPLSPQLDLAQVCSRYNTGTRDTQRTAATWNTNDHGISFIIDAVELWIKQDKIMTIHQNIDMHLCSIEIRGLFSLQSLDVMN